MCVVVMWQPLSDSVGTNNNCMFVGHHDELIDQSVV
jgi:hypothetical protein